MAQPSKWNLVLGKQPRHWLSEEYFGCFSNYQPKTVSNNKVPHDNKISNVIASDDNQISNVIASDDDCKASKGVCGWNGCKYQFGGKKEWTLHCEQVHFDPNSDGFSIATSSSSDVAVPLSIAQQSDGINVFYIACIQIY